MALTPKQRRFAQEYLVDSNGTQAAIRAGYSPKTAKSQAHDLLTKPDIQGAVKKAQERISGKLDITAEYILGSLKKIADEGEQEHNRVKALELLGKNHKLFTDKVQHSLDKTLEQLLLEASEKEP